MSWTTRFANLFRQRRLNHELEEELASHVAEAMERGRSAAEARQALERRCTIGSRAATSNCCPGWMRWAPISCSGGGSSTSIAL
jgi:hypothetical protein